MKGFNPIDSVKQIAVAATCAWIAYEKKFYEFSIAFFSIMMIYRAATLVV